MLQERHGCGDEEAAALTVDAPIRRAPEEIELGKSSIAKVAAAVIGTGFIGTVHVEALRRIGVQVRGVLGSTPERGQARVDALGVPRAYDSLQELLADDTVDVVHVTSPNDLHVSQSRRSSRPASTSSARSRSR